MHTALLVIDVQEGLFSPTPRPDAADGVIHRINELAHRARDAATPVIFIQHEQAQGLLAFGSPGWQLPSSLVMKPEDHRVRKTTPDAFLRTHLEEILQSLGVRRLVVCGYASEFCVDTTVRRAAGLGYAVLLAADAHTTHDKAHASGAWIRNHVNATLPSITSFGVPIAAIASVDIEFGDAIYRKITC